MSNINDPLYSLFENFDKNAEFQKARTGDSNTWNILVQILLPIVFVLTFVIVTGIFFYKVAYEAIQQGILETDSGIREKEKQEAIIEAQLQKLLKYLEQIKNAKKEELKLSLFPASKNIITNGIQITDENFKELCGKTKTLFESPVYSQEYLNTIYQQVLDSAGVKDEQHTKVIRWETTVDDADDMLKIGEFYKASGTVIYYKNRRIIHNNILDFYAGLTKTTIGLQERVIRYLFSELLKPENTGQLDEKAREIIARLLNPQTPEPEKNRVAEELYKHITQKWHKHLDNGGYTFLEATWEKLKVLN